MSFLVPVLLVVALIAVVLSVLWHHSRGRELLDEWAEREGLMLVSADYCWFWRGPFWWRSGNGNAVYRVAVRDDQGRDREGYVRCGGLFFGMLSDAVDVVWDS